jgi:hypothetical protein
MIGLTRVERVLRDGKFAQGVIDGLNGHRVTGARALQAEMRERVGYARASAPVLTSGASQVKLGKNTLKSFGLMLIPERGLMSVSFRDVREAFGLTGGFNLCPLASAGCAAACLSRSGKSGMPSGQRAQGVRTAFLLAFPYQTGLIVGAELLAALRKYGEINLRLNTTSDIRWELFAPDMLALLTLKGVKLYDYTAWSPANRKASSSYPLTYSAKEPAATSDEYLSAILRDGGTVAMPFDTKRGHALPATWQGFAVIDGDVSDERRLDPKGVIVGLRAKGHEWRKDNSAGFIRSAV